MGIFGLFKKEKPIQIDIYDAEEWVRKNFSGKIEESRKRLEELYKNLVKEFSELKNLIDALSTASFEGEGKSSAVVNMTKDMIVKRGTALINNILSIKFDTSYDSIREFVFTAEEALRDIGSLTPKQAVVLTKYFSSHGSEISKKVKTIHSELKELREFLEGKGKLLKTIDDIKDNVNRYIEITEQLGKTEERRNEIIRETKQIKSVVEREKKELESILSGEDYKRIEKIQKETDEIKNKIQEKETKIKETLSSIIRPVKKFEYLINKEYLLPKDEENTLLHFLENPFESVVSEKERNLLKNILKKLKDVSEQGMLELKMSEKSKVSSVLKSLEKDIPAVLNEIDALRKEIERKEKEREGLSDILQRKTDLEESIERNETQVKNLEEELKHLEEEEETLKEEIESKTEEIKKGIEAFTEKKIILTRSKD
ncbi:MAG: hypothetical protein DRP18_00730 [Candidatus Aenigmatarchaeota archaeon]|nr:MAG: hypothetical protein DRP18_00730 [Candidatus Aenigmarchaeota archaeon]